MSEPVKIALVGGGLIGKRHAQHILKNKDATLVAYIDPAPQALAQAETWKCLHFTSVTAMLKDVKPDGAIIATPNHTHVPIATELIQAGVAVLVEKPVAVTVDEGLRLLQVVKQYDGKAMVGHHRRFNPYISAAKQVIDSGLLGEVTAVQGIWALQKPTNYFEPPTEWRRDGKTGGPLLINAVHDVDILAYLIGNIENVMAMEAPNRRGFSVTEGVSVTLQFTNGAVGNMLVLDNVASPWSMEAGTGENPTIPRTGQEFLKIIGTRGSLSVPSMTRWSYDHVEGEKGWTEVLMSEALTVENENVLPFDLQLINFINVVRMKEEPRCSVEDGVRALMVCEAVKLSVSEKRMVSVHNTTDGIK